MDKSEMKQRLDDIFRGLWANRKGVTGSWGTSSYQHHPTYIRRGPVLLQGETSFSYMWVLIPGDCEVTPVYGNSCAYCNTFPVVSGEVIEVSLSDEGPWLEYLAKEIPRMEAELKESYAKREATEQKVKEERAAKRRAELDAAKAIFTREVI